MSMDDRINYLIHEALQSIVLRIENDLTLLREEIRLLHEEIHNKPQTRAPVSRTTKQ